MEKIKSKKIKAWLAPIIYFGLKNKAYDFIENLSYFLSAGMSIADALISIKEETRSWRMRRVIERIESDIAEGMPLSESFANQNFFGPNIVALINSGELSGNLVKNLKLAVLLNDEDKRLKSKLNSSLLYGTIIMVITVIVGAGTAWYVLPRIAEVYSEMNVELPFLTRMLIRLGEFLAHYGYLVVPIFFLLIAMILYFLFSFPKTKFIGHFFLFHLPFVGELIRESEVTRFGYLLGNMMETGLPITEALRVLPGTTTFKNYKKMYKYLEDRISEGLSLLDSLKAYPGTRRLFPGSVIQMLSSAEKSGKLAETLIRISTLYEAKLENTSRNLPLVMEPIILIFVGLGVALFVLATILPIYNLSNIIN